MAKRAESHMPNARKGRARRDFIRGLFAQGRYIVVQGKVQRFSELKGFGFILQDFRTKLFFHVSAWQSNIAPRIGMMVSFEVAAPNKPGQQFNQAINIVPVVSSVDGAK